jgi:hypothetical protein
MAILKPFLLNLTSDFSHTGSLRYLPSLPPPAFGSYFVSVHTWIIFIYFIFFVGLGLNSGLCTYKAGTLPLEPHLQSYTWIFLMIYGGNLWLLFSPR